jgi:SAM-dependent methyltransferase
MTPEQKRAFAAAGPGWTYEFDLGDGVRTPLLAEELRSVNRTRTDLIMPIVERCFADGLRGRRVLDAGCNEGYFSHLMYQRGAMVTGFDIRAANIERAETLRSILGMDPARLRFEQRDLFELDTAAPYDIVLFLGLLYHLENPAGAIRRLHALTGTLCLIETQLTRQREPLYSGWGRETVTLELPASFAVLHEPSQEVDRLASYGTLSFIPNAAAVRLMLEAAGFVRIEQLAPQAGMNRQYVRNDRAVFAAWKDAASG